MRNKEESTEKSTDNKIRRRDLVTTMGAMLLIMDLGSGCAPMLLADSMPSSRIGENTMPTDSNEVSFRFFLRDFEEGLSRFVNGDGAAWKSNASQGEDATIMGAWGAYEQGWEEVSARYDWAAARFMES